MSFARESEEGDGELGGETSWEMDIQLPSALFSTNLENVPEMY